MLKNYLQVARRSIVKQKGYSLITVSGLAIGMVCCMFLLLWVQDELSYDRFHENADHIFRVEVTGKGGMGERYAETPCALGPAIRDSIPEAISVARVFDREMMRLQAGDHSFYERNLCLVDPSFFRIFSFHLLQGDPETVLRRPYSMVLSEKMARKYFAGGEAVGRTVLLNGQHAFTVSGIVRDSPVNSTIRPEILIGMDFMARVPGEYDLGWKEFCWTTWVQLDGRADVAAVAKKITRILEQNVSGFAAVAAPMPIKGIRLDGKNKETVWILTALAVFILLLACINFVNLATARAAKRAREIGVRKVVGAFRRDIMAQFYCEAAMLASLALALALALVACLRPAFNGITGKAVAAGSFFSFRFILGVAGVALLAGAASGSYPALLLSRFHPIQVLKGSWQAGARSGWMRKTLVVTQFCLSVILLVGTVVIGRQLHYLRSKPVGYDRERLLYVPLPDDGRGSYPVFKEALHREPAVRMVTGTSQRPTALGRRISGGADWEGRDPGFNPPVDYGQVDIDWVGSLKIPLLAGRPFSRDIASDPASAVIVNETLMKMMGPGPAVGKRFAFSGRPGLKAFQGTVVGVMKDFHYRRLQDKIGPLALFAAPEAVAYAVLRLPAGDASASLAAVRSTWRRVFRDAPFEATFFEEDFAETFKADERLERLAGAASLLAILVSCLGLFGLASFMAEQRTKEIGIRKVLGASAQGIAFLLAREFLAWVAAANLIACPLAYLLARRWLEGYPYKVSIQAWVFGLGVLATLAMALLAVGGQTLKAARANPVQSITYE